MMVSFTTQRLAMPIPPLFQQIVVAGVLGAVTGPSGRVLPGDAASAVVDPNGGVETPNGRNRMRGNNGRGRGDDDDVRTTRDRLRDTLPRQRPPQPYDIYETLRTGPAQPDEVEEMSGVEPASPEVMSGEEPASPET
jgi:hypothetical protein